MKIDNNIYIVASGDMGYNVSNEIDCTVYLLDMGNRLVLIDSGSGIDNPKIVKNIVSHNFSPKKIDYILLTHAHADHSGGAKGLSELCNCKVCGFADTAEIVSSADIIKMSLKNALHAGVYPDRYEFSPCKVEELKENQILHFDNGTIEVIKSLGHSTGHCCYLLTLNGKKALFSGDSIFFGGKISLQPIWDCDLLEYVNTISRLNKLDFKQFFPAHLTFCLKNGKRHIVKAKNIIDNMEIPKNIIGD